MIDTDTVTDNDIITWHLLNQPYTHLFPFKLQRDYEEYKVRVNALVAKAQKTPDEGWTMQDGTPWPGNNTRDHPGMIQVRSTFVYHIFMLDR